MTRDAKNKQSVETCKYEHQWVKASNERIRETGEFPVKCAKCPAMPKGKEIKRAEAICDLREMLKPGDVVYTTVKHVSRSGMSRVIDVHLIINNEPRWIAYSVGRACDYPFDDKREALRVGGCGMDMGFAVVYELGRTLFPDGFGVEGELPLGHKIRPATKEKAAKAVEKGAKFRGRNGDPSGWDNDGGYALNQRWL
jgi:hypothetical protein